MKIIDIIKSMNINLDDKLVKELDSVFENERKTQVEWDVCIEDIVEEFIARQKGTWYEDNYVEEQEEEEEIYHDLRDIGKSKKNDGKSTSDLTQPPFIMSS
jgi:metal-responsive CopG/Arc/MetJ family transcriptional regulator